MGLKQPMLSACQTGGQLELFASGSTTQAAGKTVGMHRNTAGFFCQGLGWVAEYQTEKDIRSIWRP